MYKGTLPSSSLKLDVTRGTMPKPKQYTAKPTPAIYGVVCKSETIVGNPWVYVEEDEAVKVVKKQAETVIIHLRLYSSH
jgi:hypothetical protein